MTGHTRRLRVIVSALLPMFFCSVTVTADAGPNESSHAAAVEKCWNRTTVEPEAWDASILVSFMVGRDGRPRAETIRMDRADPSRPVGTLLFPSAKRAILRCAVLMPMPPQPGPIWLVFSINDGVRELTEVGSEVFGR